MIIIVIILASLAMGIFIGKIMYSCSSKTERDMEYQDEARIYGYKLKDLEVSEMDDTERFHHIEK